MSEMLLILLPGAMYFWTLFIGQGPFQEILQERESRISARILASPVTPGQYVLAKMVTSFVLCGLTTILLMLASAVLLGMRWGNALALGAAVVAWAGSMTGLLALIYAVARTQKQATVLSPMVLMVFAMVGGSMFPYESLPAFLQTIGQFTPNRWAVLALQGVARARPLSQLVAPMTGLLALWVFGWLLGFIVLQRRMASGERE